MILFKVYFIFNGSQSTAAEDTFYNSVHRAILLAFNAKERGQTSEELSNGFTFLSKAEAKQMFKRDLQTPSVAIKYRNNQAAAFKAAFLKGVGKPAAWTKAAKSIFDGVPVPSSEKGEGDAGGGLEDGDADKDANGKGNGSGSGTNSGSGLDPFRKCNPFDNALLTGASTILGFFNVHVPAYKIRKYLYYGGAAVLATGTVLSDNKKVQVATAVGAGTLVYFGYQDPECLPKK